jgi:dTDP-4-dehydrorhamnose 3,5-epimerase
MRFTETRLKGAYVLDLERREDERGFFARTWCEDEFRQHGLNPRLVQCNISFNNRRGTLRGLHYQIAPHEEAKLVRCTMGAIYDVIVDLRQGSPTYMEWTGVELSAANRRSLYVPEGYAHGFQTLTDDAEILYHMSEFYAPGAGRGLRWNDASLGIHWPLAVSVVSEADSSYPDFYVERDGRPEQS